MMLGTMPISTTVLNDYECINSSLPPSLPPSHHTQHESQQRENWQLMSEVDKLRFRVIELERRALIGGRRPGDSTTYDRSSELCF